MELSEDQYRFLVANAAGIGLALQYNFVPKSIRQEFHFLPGVLMVYYCFGRQANSLMLFSGISYLICRFTPWKHVHLVSLISSIAFLSYTHLNRQILDYGGYVLDISGPFMIAVQKVTSLGFCLYDGGYFKIKNESSKLLMDDDDNNNVVSEDLPFCNQNIMSISSINSHHTKVEQEESDKNIMNKRVISKPKSDRDLMILEERKKFSIQERLTFREFFGYFFHFPSVLCGPIVYFNDYMKFVDDDKEKETPPGKWSAVIKKLTISITCSLLHLSLSKMFDVRYLRTDEFQIKTPFVIRFGYIIVLTIISRIKYYVAWHLGEVISNTSGLGFAGYDAKGKAKWDLLSNMELWRFETCLSMRDSILAWNKTTQTWLRRTAYDRVPRKFSVLATYTLSAIWHGFYPGYYMTFLGGALFTVASRQGRRLVRPLFQRTLTLQKLYDIITFILTRLTIAYVAFPFVILDFRGSYEIYKSLYFSLHILGVFGIVMGLLLRRNVK